MASLELWGGAECTVNRVGNSYRDQLSETGHDRRCSDVRLISELGVVALRTPVLWERVSPGDPAQQDWALSDRQLSDLRLHGIRPIVGLIHHGSGPGHTDLLSPDFAPGLADHAGAVAARYPWVDDWTPVNEPCTTARFACLYGHWYPHRRDERDFWTALLNQVDATRLAMRAIRAVNPQARLIQTDDLGRTYATGAMGDWAGYYNARRWMAWDLLCGDVVPGHAMWDRLCGFGLGQRLREIADDPCRPDVIGINHYLTSDRFLDHRVARYPDLAAAGFVDTEAVRVLDPPPPGLAGVMREAWDRYRIPLAVTEVHNGCTREEQLRWLANAWTSCTDLRAQGVDVRAVTAWALFGSAGWNTLLTSDGVYEPGAFDVSGGAVRETAIAPTLRAIGRGAAPRHPVLAGPGWWQRDIRLHHPRAPRPAPMREHVAAVPRAPFGRPEPLLIVGATGTLGRALAAACRHRNIAHVVTDRGQLWLDDADGIARALDRHRPWAVINAAGWVRVDDAEAEEEACFAANSTGAQRLAAACDARGITSVAFSSDLVFDGTAGRPYVEGDVARPLNVYGRSKAAAEQAIRALPGNHLMVRTAAFFSPFDMWNFAHDAVTALRGGGAFAASADHVVTPTYVPDLCDAVLDLVIDGERGLWHLTNGEAVSWYDFACRIAESTGLESANVVATRGDDPGWRARRPRHVPLGTERGQQMPPLADALRRYAREVAVRDRVAAVA